MAEPRRRKPTSDIYTVLAGIALLVLIVGIGYVWYRQYQLTDTFSPIDLGPQTSAVPAEVVSHQPTYL